MRETARILYVLKYLQEQSDEQHPVTTKQILEFLELQGLKTNRHTIPADIKLLCDLGYDIVTVKQKTNLYFIGERHFQLPEIKLLIDGVLSSKFITPKKSKVLIEKLRGLVSEHQKAEFQEGLFTHERIKPHNEKIYLTTDVIQTAINRKKKITFKYFDYSPEKKKIYTHNGYVYEFSPYALLWHEDKYYSLGFSAKHNKIVTFRVDRMSGVKITETNVIPKPKGFDVSEFCKQVFEMFDGRSATVELECKNELMKVIIDRFGEEVQTEITDGEHFKATAQVYISPMFFGWLFQFTGRMRITAPADVVREYKKMLNTANANI